VLDFAFARALEEVIAKKQSTAVLERLFADDGLYEGGELAALRLPTFSGNHDFGRFAWLVQLANPGISDAELLARVKLSNAMMFLLRGVPVVYYGDEQGFIGHGNDQASRQSMFASQVASYNDQALVGTKSTTARTNFETTHPLYLQVAGLSKLRQRNPALRRGRQLVRAFGANPHVFAASRIGNDGREIVIAFNTSTAAITLPVEIETGSAKFTPLAGDCPASADAPGSLTLRLPPLGYVACLGSPK
jgi:glycosidase